MNFILQCCVRVETGVVNRNFIFYKRKKCDSVMRWGGGGGLGIQCCSWVRVEVGGGGLGVYMNESKSKTNSNK